MILLTVLGGIVASFLGLMILWRIWEGFRSLVLGFEAIRITRLEQWQEAWQPYLQQLKKQQDTKNVKKTRS